MEKSHRNITKLLDNSIFIQYIRVIDAFIMHTLLIFFTSNCKINDSNSRLMQNFGSVKLTDVKMYLTKYHIYALLQSKLLEKIWF